MLAKTRRVLGLIHGKLGAVGLGLAALAMRAGTLRGPFAWDRLGLLAAALLLGAAIYFCRPQGAIVLHAMLGGIGYLLLAGFALSLV